MNMQFSPTLSKIYSIIYIIIYIPMSDLQICIPWSCSFLQHHQNITAGVYELSGICKLTHHSSGSSFFSLFFHFKDCVGTRGVKKRSVLFLLCQFFYFSQKFDFRVAEVKTGAANWAGQKISLLFCKFPTFRWLVSVFQIKPGPGRLYVWLGR